MTYAQTLNKLVRLFGTITDKRQVPMAVSYAKLLVFNLDLTPSWGDGCDYDGYYAKEELMQLIKKNADEW